MARADGRTVGSVYIRVRPDVDGFRRETQDKIGRKPYEVEIDIEVDDSKIDKSLDDAQKKAGRRKLDISYEVDRKSLNRAMGKIDDAIKSLGLEHLSINMDAESLKNARRKVQDELGTLDGSKVRIEYTEDNEGKRKILNTLKQIQSEQREVKVGQWDVNQESLEESIKKLEGSIELPLKVDYKDQSSLDRAITEIDKRLADMKAVEISVELNEESLRDMKATLEYSKELLADPLRIDLTYNADNPESIGSAIKAIEAEMAKLDALDLSVNLDSESLAKAKAELEAAKKELEDDSIELQVNWQDSGSLRAAMSKLTGELATLDAAEVRVAPDRSSILATIAEINAALGRNFEAQVEVQGTGFAATEARLQALSRDRIINLRARLTGRAARLLEGGFRSLAGINDIEEMVNAFENLVTNFDMISTQAAVMGTAIGSAVNVGTFAVAGLFTTLADASRVVGLLAAVPTALLAAGAVMQTHTAIWSDFEAGLMGIPEVLEAMPPNARAAVEAINELSDATNGAVQNGFWGTMNDEIARFADEVAPTLTRGMERTAETYGDTLSGMLDLTTAWVRSGELGAAFSNINKGLESIGTATVSVFDGFMTMGLRGSAMFPRLGFEIDNLATSFNNWVQSAAAMGKIERWIQQGIDALSLLTQAGGATMGILSGLTQAFRNAGIGGLPEFVAGLQQAETLMQSPVWQMKMGNIFEGAIDGARLTFEGFARIAEVIYEADEETGNLLRTIGEVAREAQILMAVFLEQPILQSGVQDFFDGLRDSLEQLGPSAQSLGDIFGTLGSLAGEVLREMAPGVNTLLGIFSDAANALRDNLIEAVHPLTTFIDNIGHASRAMVNGLLPAVNGILTAFNGLPGVMQNFIALALVASRYMSSFSAMTLGALSPARLTASGASMLYLRDAVVNTGRAFQGMGRYVGAISFMGLQRAGTTAMVGVSTAADRAARQTRTGFTNAFSAIKTAGRGLGGIFMGLLGGLPGIALLAIVTTVGLIASKFGQAKAEAEEFKSSVRGLSDLMRDGNDDAIFDETFGRLEDTLKNIERVGGDAGNVMNDILDGKNVAGFAKDWEKVGDAIDRSKAAAMDGGALFTGYTPDEQAALERLGLDWETASQYKGDYFRDIASQLNTEAQMHGEASSRLQDRIKAEREAGEAIAMTGKAAREAYEENPATFAESSDAARDFASAVLTVGDASASADSRVAALRQVMATLSGSLSEPADAAIQAWDNLTAAMGTAEQIAETQGQIMGSATNGIATDYESMSERQKLAIQGVSQLHDAAMARAIEAYDREIAKGGDSEAATRKGISAYESLGAEVGNFAEQAGLSAEETKVLQGEWDQLANSSDIELALNLQGMSEQELAYTYDAMQRIHEAGLEISENEYMAFIAANPDQAYLQVSQLEVVLANMEANEYLVKLLGDNSGALEDIAEAVGAGEAFDDGSYDAVLKAILETDDLDAAAEALYEWDQSEGTGTFKSKDEASEALNDILPKLEEYEGSYAADLIANGSDPLITTLDTLNELLTEIAKEWGIDIDANDNASAKIVPLKDRVDDLGTGKTSIDIDANDNATPKIGPLGATLGSITATPWNAELTATDGASGPANNAKSAVDGIPGFKAVALTAGGNVISFAGTAVSTIGNVNSKGVALTAAGNVISFASEAIGRISGMNSKQVALTAAGNVISFASTAISTIGRILSKTVIINAVGNALSTLGSIVSLLGSVVSKTVTVTVKRAGAALGGFAGALGKFVSGSSENGNIYPGVHRYKQLRPQKFANGGFSENHSAQIATATTPYRIWAEPETGGEAYIPLAASKRARSTAIWRETGKRLGVYADGGVTAGGNASTGASRPVYINNHYPRAEKTSDTLKRAMSYDSMWDLQDA